MGLQLDRVTNVKFLGVHITEDLSWTNNTTTLVQRAQLLPYFLRCLGSLQILPLHHRECPDRLHHGLLRKLLCLQPQGPPGLGEDASVHPRHIPIPTRLGHLLKTVPEEATQHHQETHTRQQ